MGAATAGVDGVEQSELADGIAGFGGGRGQRIGTGRAGQPGGGHLLGRGHSELDGRDGSPKTIAVTFTVAAAAAAGADALDDIGELRRTAGGAIRPRRRVSVSNTGSGTMAWTASSNQSWLTVSPASGTNSGTLAIGANLSGLAAGTYTGAVTVSATGATGSPKTIAVTLTVAAAAMTISAAPTAVTLNCTAGSNPSATTVGDQHDGDSGMDGHEYEAMADAVAGVGHGRGDTLGGRDRRRNDRGLLLGYGDDQQHEREQLARDGECHAECHGGNSAPPAGNGNNWYVSPNGSPSGTGSISSPWDIVTALAQPAAVRPGDTIWVRAGKYGGGQYNSQLTAAW